MRIRDPDVISIMVCILHTAVEFFHKEEMGLIFFTALILLLMSMVNEKQPFSLRCSVLYCVQSFLYKVRSYLDDTVFISKDQKITMVPVCSYIFYNVIICYCHAIPVTVTKNTVNNSFTVCYVPYKD
jgi:hypothetical protein